MFGQFFSTQSIALFSFSFTNAVGFTLKDRGVDLFPRQLRAMLFNKCSGRDEAWVSAFFLQHRDRRGASPRSYTFLIFDVSLLFLERIFWFDEHFRFNYIGYLNMTQLRR